MSPTTELVTTEADATLNYGFIPDEMRAGLAAVSRSAKLVTGAEVTFLGVAEGVLFYEVHRVGYGILQLHVYPVVKGGVRRRFPALTTQEVSRVARFH